MADNALCESTQRLLDLLPARLLDVGKALRPWPSNEATVSRELLLPLLVEPDWPGPATPLPVGDGWVQADLTDEDIDTFDRLRATVPGAGPEELATAAQEWRLPVLPYRPLPTLPPELAPEKRALASFSGASSPDGAALEGVGALEGARVVDLSSLWAGPFCTQLLRQAGAAITKVDPDCRPDGFRERTNLYAELNDGKEIVDLDLRHEADRAGFEELVRDADLLIHSFSRRVLPNLGYGPSKLKALNPKLATVSISAFPLGTPEQDWLAYGSGIHAVSGLGLATGRARAAAVAYPDPLTGYAAASAAIDIAGSAESREVSLAAAGVVVAKAQHGLATP